MEGADTGVPWLQSAFSNVLDIAGNAYVSRQQTQNAIDMMNATAQNGAGAVYRDGQYSTPASQRVVSSGNEISPLMLILIIGGIAFALSK